MLADRFGILFVCHANQCRSPLAEGLTGLALHDAFGPAAQQVSLASAGTHAITGAPMHPGSVQVLAEHGIDADGFASRPLTPALLCDAGLVLAAAREQRAACVTMAPAAVRRTFTLRQFLRFVSAVPAAEQLTRGTPADRLRALMEQVNAVRHLVQPVAGDDDDLPDPVGQPIEAFRVCGDEIRKTMEVIVGVIATA